MTLFLLQIETRSVTATDLIVISAVIVGTAVITRLIRPAMRTVLTRLARRSAVGAGGRWHVRTPRIFGETDEEASLRRRQRINATAAGFSRLLSAILWVAALIAILQRAEVDPMLAISGAGFLGVAIAVGGQHSVNDFLTGLHILIEDRFGEGDRLRLKLNDEDVVVTVASLGAFSTRLEDGVATFHIPNRELTTIANLSQRGSTTEIEFEPSGQVPAVKSKGSVEAAIQERYRNTREFDGSRDGLIIDSIESDGDNYTVSLRTARPLTDQQRQALTRNQP